MKAIDLSERQKQILAYMDAGVEYSTEHVLELQKREGILKCRSGCYVGDDKHEQIFRKRLENIQK